jgi:hypothetical protein
MADTTLETAYNDLPMEGRTALVKPQQNISPVDRQAPAPVWKRKTYSIKFLMSLIEHIKMGAVGIN